MPAHIRVQGYRAQLIQSGGRRTSLDLSPEANAALKSLTALDGGSEREAINKAIVNEAQRRGTAS